MKNLDKVTKGNYRDYATAYLMMAENCNIKQKIIKAEVISESNKFYLKNNLNTALVFLNQARPLIHDVEYLGGDLTAYPIPSIYHTIDDLINKITSILKDVNVSEADLIDCEKYLKVIELFEK